MLLISLHVVVIAVKLSLDNADHRLKPGMPASVR